MKPRAFTIYACLQLLSLSADALLTPVSTGSLILKASASSSSNLGNTVASPVDLPRGGSSEKGLQGGGTATIPNEVFNLVKSIVGAGVLSLPAGK